MAKRSTKSAAQESNHTATGKSSNDPAANDPRVAAPELYASFCRLRTGNPTTVRDTLVDAFQKNDQDGFDSQLVTACWCLDDVPMCQRLFRVVHELIRFAPFVTFASWAYTSIVGCTRSNEVRRLAAAGIGEFMFSNPSLDDLFPKKFTAAVRKRICKRIIEATTGSQTTEAKTETIPDFRGRTAQAGKPPEVDEGKTETVPQAEPCSARRSKRLQPAEPSFRRLVLAAGEPMLKKSGPPSSPSSSSHPGGSRARPQGAAEVAEECNPRGV